MVKTLQGWLRRWMALSSVGVVGGVVKVKRRIRQAFIASKRALAIVLALLAGMVQAADVAKASGQTWINAWSAPQSDAFGSIVLDKQTLRQMLTVLHPGDTLRIRLSNRYGRAPVTLDAVHIGLAEGEAGFIAGMGRDVLFHGQARVTLAPGASIWSDPIALKVESMQRLAMSLYAAGRMTGLSKHTNGVEFLWRAPGNRAAQPGGEGFKQFGPTYVVLADALDVRARAGTRVLAVFGDSIIEGFSEALVVQPSPGRWPGTEGVSGPELLAARLGVPGQRFSLVNTAMLGNRLLDGGWLPIFGEPGIQRLDRDVLSVSGLTDVIVMIGINDLGLASVPQPQAMIDGLRDITGRMQAAGLRVHLGTIPPNKGSGLGRLGPLLEGLNLGFLHGRESVNRARGTVNEWIRGASSADRVVDFDACLRDPGDPDHLLPAYDSGDHLHVSVQGFEAMAHCLDLASDPR